MYFKNKNKNRKKMVNTVDKIDQAKNTSEAGAECDSLFRVGLDGVPQFQVVEFLEPFLKRKGKSICFKYK